MASAREASMKLEDFALGKPLGQGFFGRVWKAKHIASGKVVVLKMMMKDALVKADVVGQIKREIEIHYRCRHNNIVRMYCYFQTSDKIFLVLEYANGGTLYDMLQACPQGFLDEPTAAQYLLQMIEVLHYLRTAKAVPIIHRDIKPENILVHRVKSGPDAGSLRLKLADFGWAVAMVPDSYRITLCGTPEYMPPEVVSEDAYSGAFDIWTLGILLFEMLAGTTPFETPGDAEEADEDARIAAITDRIIDGTFQVPGHISSEAADLLQGMLTSDQDKRLRPAAIRRHPWMVRHCGEPAEGSFTPSTAGTKLAREAILRASSVSGEPQSAAAAGAAGGADSEHVAPECTTEPELVTSEPASITSEPAPEPTPVAATTPPNKARRVLVEAHGNPEGKQQKSKQVLASRGKGSGQPVKVAGVVSKTTSKRTLVRKQAGPATRTRSATSRMR